MRTPFVSLFALVLLAALPAQAQWSSASVFTEDGVELGVEPRVFAVYALLNAAGYDKESVFGPLPLQRPRFSATREKLRQNIGRSNSPELSALIEKNPVSAQVYAAAVLELGPAPRFDDKAATSPLAKALAPLLREWFNEEGGSALLRNANEDARVTQKRLLTTLDAAIKGTTALVRLGDHSDQLLDDVVGATGRVAIVLNDLDASGTLFVLQAGATTGIITGPARGPADDELIIDVAAFAYAQTLVAAEAAKVAAAGTLVEGFAKLAAAASTAVVDGNGYARALLACSFAREIRKRPLSCGGIEGDPEAEAALALLAPRISSYATTTALLSAAMGDLMALPPPPPVVVEPVKEEPKKKGKKG